MNPRSTDRTDERSRRTEPVIGDLPLMRRALVWLYLVVALCLVLAAVLWWQLLK